MSCGCGGGGLPPSLTLRLEAARLALAAGPDVFDTLAPKVLAFVMEGTDPAELDRPAVPIATGDSPEAVTSRNAFINTPLQRVALERGVVAKLAAAGMHVLGALVQVDGDHLGRADVSLPEAAQLALDLKRYGLALGMTSEAVRTWIVEGPAQ